MVLLERRLLETLHEGREGAQAGDVLVLQGFGGLAGDALAPREGARRPSLEQPHECECVSECVGGGAHCATLLLLHCSGE